MTRKKFTQAQKDRQAAKQYLDTEAWWPSYLDHAIMAAYLAGLRAGRKCKPPTS